MSRNRYVGDGYSLRVVERPKARRLIVFGPQHAYWSLPTGEYALAEEVTGAIVKVQPPPGATEDHVRLLQAALERGEAARVRVAPWARVAEEAPLQYPRVAAHESAGPREVVMALARRSKRADELAPLLDGILTEVGL